jgi:ditrans,polycis-polyprenyl diphosphate synthase
MELSFLERHVILPVLKSCEIPGHIGFIMDGNRRHARCMNEHTLVGHRQGYERLQKVLLWCYEIGVQEVSVYAFSVDNFSRSTEEVDYLMNLAIEKLAQLVEPGSFIMKHGIRVRVCGDKSLLRPELQAVIDRVESETSEHTAGYFNVLLAYSSKRELDQAIQRAHFEVSPKCISWLDIESRLYNSTPLDLVVRTSGETRLSDFLIWQLQPEKTLVVFEKHFWPSYSIFDFAKCLLRYDFFRRHS